MRIRTSLLLTTALAAVSVASVFAADPSPDALQVNLDAGVAFILPDVDVISQRLDQARS